MNRGNYRRWIFAEERIKAAFQACRYKSLLVEPGGAFGLLCDYIHLNPVCAGLLEVSQLGRYRHSSYWFMQRPAPCKLAIAAWLKSNRDA